jgi:hypothetical protein
MKSTKKLPCDRDRAQKGRLVWELGNASDSDDDDQDDPKKDVERAPRAIETRGGYSGRDEHQGLVEEGDDSDSDDFR